MWRPRTDDTTNDSLAVQATGQRQPVQARGSSATRTTLRCPSSVRPCGARPCCTASSAGRRCGHPSACSPSCCLSRLSIADDMTGGWRGTVASTGRSELGHMPADRVRRAPARRARASCHVVQQSRVVLCVAVGPRRPESRSFGPIGRPTGHLGHFRRPKRQPQRKATAKLICPA